MRRLLVVLVAAPVAALVTILATAPSALAGDVMQGDIHVMKPWSRPLPPVSPNGAAYVTIMNMGGEPDRLLSVATPAAERAELHTHSMQGGMAKMRRLESVDVGPGETVVFEPGGHHIMLMGLATPLVEGKSYPLTLRFERAGEVEVEVMITEPKGGASRLEHDHGESKQGG